MDDRTGTPLVASWAKTHEFQSRFSHEKTKHVIFEETHDRTGTPVVGPQRGARPHQFIIGDDETELELSLGSRSFLDRVNDQVRKRQKRISNVTRDGEKQSMIWGMFMSLTMESAVFMGKNYMNNCHSIANTKDLTLKQMFDISTRLVSEQGEISGLETIGWENHSWKYLPLIGEERIINLQRTKVYVFSDSALCLGKIHENPQSNDPWERRLGWFKSSPEYRNFDRIDGEPMDFEWNIFPRFNTLQLSDGVKSLLLKLGETPENFEELYSCQCSTTSHVDHETMKKNACQMPISFLYMYSISKDSPQGEWDNMAERMLLEFAESGCPIFRATTPLSRGRLKSKRHGKLSIHFAADLETFETIFRIIVSANQLSLYGAIAEIFEEYETLHERTGRPAVGGQSSSSLVPSVIKTEVPLDCDDPVNQNLLLQQCGERIEKL